MTPIPASEDVSSLSAILLDDDYYAWIRAGDRVVAGIHMVGAEYLIPLKMKAWLDLTERQVSGEQIDSRKIRKHQNDVFRLYTILAREPLPAVPASIRQDVDQFIREIAAVEIDFKSMGLGSLTVLLIACSLDLVFQEHRAHRYVLHPIGAGVFFTILNTDRPEIESTALNCRL